MSPKVLCEKNVKFRVKTYELTEFADISNIRRETMDGRNRTVRLLTGVGEPRHSKEGWLRIYDNSE